MAFMRVPLQEGCNGLVDTDEAFAGACARVCETDPPLRDLSLAAAPRGEGGGIH